AAHFEITAERGGKAKTDGLEDRIDAERDALAIECRDGLVEPVERPWEIGNRHDLNAPVAGADAVGRIDAQHQGGTGRDGGGNFDRIEAVDRDVVTAVTERRYGIADATPRSAWVASKIDPVGPLAGPLCCHCEQLFRAELRHVIDLRQDLDI